MEDTGRDPRRSRNVVGSVNTKSAYRLQLLAIDYLINVLGGVNLPTAHAHVFASTSGRSLRSDKERASRSGLRKHKTENRA